MEFNVQLSPVSAGKVPCVLVTAMRRSTDQNSQDSSQKATAGSVSLSAHGAKLNDDTDGLLQGLIDQKQITGSAGQVDLLHQPYGAQVDLLAVLGLGEADKCDHENLCKALKCAYKYLNKRNISSFYVDLGDLSEAAGMSAYDTAKSLTQALYETFYQYDETLSAKAKPAVLDTVHLIPPADVDNNTLERGIAMGSAIGKAMCLSRTLSNLPGNICTPTYLANKAQELQKKHAFSTTILDESKMKKLKMNALLSVSRGSVEPAKLIIMEYQNAPKDEAPVVLVGKGLTFDAGGISIKPAAAMDEMKYDMCGGASVFGTMQAISELALPINVVGIVASSENLPDGAANKPGDIVESMSGKTIEILNTDAEGRLILCDALTYAERYKPAAVIDIATLTGACMVALGKHTSGLFSNDDDLAAQLLEAGDAAHDRAWRLPIWDVYQPQLKSNFADLANIGGRFAGAITAACFLKRFAEEYKWAHLDIAGTAWNSGAAKGATGRPVPMLVEFLSNYQAP